jgi:hypothetical protein
MSQVNAVTTILGLSIDLVNEIIILAIKWRRRPELTLRELISGKKVWFLQKLFDFPVSILFTLTDYRFQSTIWMCAHWAREMHTL